MSARHVVLTTGLSGADGIAQVSRLVVRALCPAAGPAARVDVLSLNDRESLGEGERHGPGVRVFGAGGRRVAFSASALRAALGGAAPAHIVCLHLHLSPLARIIAARTRRLVVFLHGIEAWRPLRWRERQAMRRADLLVANSAYTARSFLDANPGLADRAVHVCHLGVADERGQGRDEGPEPAPPGPFALIVGRMDARERYKGHDVLLDVWPRVAAEVPGARMIVVGDGDDRPRLERRAAALDGQVTFAGRLPEPALARLYRDCTFFVMPSRGEGFGLVFLEAMRAGRACIGGVGAPAEVIEDGLTGFIVNPAAPAEVQAAVLRLFREPETRERMGRAGAERVAREFTEAHFRRRFRAILGLSAQ
jgi:phosphatidylinositol alpha-1,6-mannosyltransferase